MKIEQYGVLPDSYTIGDAEHELDDEQKHILFLTSLTDAARRGAVLDGDDYYDWMDALGGDMVIVSRDDGTNEIDGIVAYDKNDSRVWVSYLAVDPSKRGRGVGRALLHHVMQQAGHRLVEGRATPTSETYYTHLGYKVGGNGSVTV